MPADPRPMLARPEPWRCWLTLAYARTAHVAFLIAMAIGFLFLSGLVPAHSVDGPALCSTWSAAVVDFALIALFGLQHSVMAREGFKRWWSRVVPAPVERSTFVLVSSLLLVGVLAHYRPIPLVIWHVDGPVAWLIWGLFGLAGAATVAATFAIDHNEFVGVRQARKYASGEPCDPIAFKPSGIYGWVRHPNTSTLIAFVWITPHMTFGHLLFAGALTAYAWIGTAFEERSLVRLYGDAYEKYRRRVPRFIPRLWPR